MRDRVNSEERGFRKFQIRWKEPLGFKDNPYLYRWTFIFFGYSLRIHHWLRSDDNRYFHDHSCDLISIILKGRYQNVVPRDPDNPDVNDAIYHDARAWRPWKGPAKGSRHPGRRRAQSLSVRVATRLGDRPSRQRRPPELPSRGPASDGR